MSYVGYIPLIKQALNELPQEHVPNLLEVGIDRGTTLVPLVVHLARTRPRFLFSGVDVLVQEQVRLIISNIDLSPEQRVACIEGNSLDVLPVFVDGQARFDVILLDGDHNYHTVTRELAYASQLVYPHTVIVVDDYDGRWSEKDLWYAERPGYENVSSVTKRVETEKHGVKAAVDDWLATNAGWTKIQPLKGEPVVLVQAIP